MSVCVHCCVSAAVDPRFKLDQFDSDQTSSGAVESVVAMMKRAHKPPPSDQSVSTSEQYATTSNTSALGAVSECTHQPVDESASSSDQSAPNPSEQTLQAELAAYLSEPTLLQPQSPLTWWAENRTSYPLLADLAQSLLAIPSTAVNRTRLCSKEGELTHVRRCSAASRESSDLVLFIMEHLSTEQQ